MYGRWCGGDGKRKRAALHSPPQPGRREKNKRSLRGHCVTFPLRLFSLLSPKGSQTERKTVAMACTGRGSDCALQEKWMGRGNHLLYLPLAYSPLPPPSPPPGISPSTHVHYCCGGGRRCSGKRTKCALADPSLPTYSPPTYLLRQVGRSLRHWRIPSCYIVSGSWILPPSLAGTSDGPPVCPSLPSIACRQLTSDIGRRRRRRRRRRRSPVLLPGILAKGSGRRGKWGGGGSTRGKDGNDEYSFRFSFPPPFLFFSSYPHPHLPLHLPTPTPKGERESSDLLLSPDKEIR